MEQMEILIVMLSVFYILEYNFLKCIFAPSRVESDPYWRAIYGVGEFSRENILKEKRKNEEKNMLVNMSTENNDFLTAIDKYEPTDIPINVSSDSEANEIVRQLQEEFGDGKISLFDDEYEDPNSYLDIADLQKAIDQEHTPSTMANNIDGMQNWIVIVVGKEGPFIHVSDGKKRWIHMGDFAEEIHINDKLMLTVEEEAEKIKVIDHTIIS